MSRIEITTLVHRPVEDVWDFITDLDRYSSVVWGEPFKATSPGPLGLGLRLEEKDGPPGKVVEFEPARRFAVEFDLPRRSTVRRVGVGHVLEPAAGGTRVTSWAELEFKGWGRVFRPLLLAYFRSNVREGIDSFKHYLEASPLADGEERVAMPARYNNLVASGAAAVVWVALLFMNGPIFALQVSWILLLGLIVAAWTVLPRLRFSRSRLRVTIGPWSRAVNLDQLDSIRWKDNTYGYGAQGTIYVRDRLGHRVPIAVGSFKRGEEWAPLLLEAAAASGAKVDSDSREILRRLG